MSELSVQQLKQLNLYLKQNPQVSREKAINLLFGGGAKQLGKGVTLEHCSIQVKFDQTITKEEAQDDAIKCIKDNAQQAQSLLDNQDDGNISKAYNKLKEKLNSELAKSNVAKVVYKQFETAELLQEAKQETLTYNEYLKRKREDLFKIFPDVDSYSDKQKQMIKQGIDSLDEKQINRLQNQALELPKKGDKNYNNGVKSFQQNFLNESTVENSTSYAIGEVRKTSTTRKLKGGYSPSNGDRLMTFEEVYALEQGVNFNKENIQKYNESANQYFFANTLNNKLQEVRNILSNDINLVEGNNANGIDPKTLENSNIRLKTSIYQALSKLYGNKLDKINKGLQDLTGETYAFKIKNTESKQTLTLDNIELVDTSVPKNSKFKQNTDMVLPSLAKKIIKQLEVNYSEKLNGKNLEDYAKAMASDYKNAYGVKDATALASAFSQDQEEIVQTTRNAVQITGMAVMIGGMAFFPPAALGGGLISSFGGIGVEAYNENTKNNPNEQKNQELKKEAFVNAALFAVGAGAGKVGSMTKAALTTQNAPKLVAAMADVGVDSSISLLGDLALTGQIDLSGEGFSQLMSLAMGHKGKITNSLQKGKAFIQNKLNAQANTKNKVLQMPDGTLIELKPDGSTDVVKEGVQKQLDKSSKNSNENTSSAGITNIIDKVKDRLIGSKANKTKYDVETVKTNIKNQFSSNSEYDKGAIANLTDLLTEDNAEFVDNALKIITKRENANYGNICAAMKYVTKENNEFALWVLKNKNIPPTYWDDVLTNADEVTIPEFKSLLKDKGFAKTRARSFANVNRSNIDLYKKYYEDKRFRGDVRLINIIYKTNQYNKPLIEEILEKYDISDQNSYELLALKLGKVNNSSKKIIAEKLLPEIINTKNHSLVIDFGAIIENTNNQNYNFLNKCIDSKNFSLDDIRSLAKFSGIDTHPRMSLLERSSLLKDFNILNPELKKVMQNNGIDVANLENFLKGKKQAIAVGKIAKDKFLKGVIANNAETKILKADFLSNSNNDVKNIMEDVISGIPEFKSIAETPKGVKTLKVLQNIMKSPEYQSFSDIDKTVCKYIVLLAEFDAKTILKNYKLGDSATSRIIDALRNKKLVADFVDGKVSEKTVVANIRNFSDYKTLETLLKADPAYANKVTSDLSQRINSTFNDFYLGQKIMFTSHVQNNGSKFPKENFKGKELRVLNLNSLDENADLSQYGFSKGTTPENVTFNVHMVDCHSYSVAVENIENMLRLSKDVYRDIAPSSTLIRGRKNGTYLEREYGVILNNENKNIATFGTDSRTGNTKDEKYFVRLLFENKSNKAYKYSFKNTLNSKYNIKLTDEEYIELMKQIQPKKYATQLKDVKIGNKVLKAEQLQDAINDCMNKATEGEITSFNPKVEAIYAKVTSLKECPEELLLLAQKYNLPIVLGFTFDRSILE